MTVIHRCPVPQLKSRDARFRTSVGRPARARVVRRCTAGPNEPRDQQRDDQPPKGSSPPDRASPREWASHPEVDDSGLVANTSSSIPDALPYLGGQSDWREFRARLVSQSRGQSDPAASAGGAEEWAHTIAKPERGALLLAHPLLFQQSQTYFHRAAILLLEHDDTGSYGVILNRPSKYRIRDMSPSQPISQFGDCRLYVGGDVGLGEVQVVHPHSQLAGAAEVVKGVYRGGLDAARQAVDAGFAQAENFRWFTAYAGWGPGQLAMECRRGVWFTAAASPKVLLQPVELGEGPQYWHRVMTMLGGDYAELSRAVQKHDDLGGGAAA